VAEIPTFQEIDEAISGKKSPGPNPRLMNLLLKKFSSAIHTYVQKVAWGGIDGRLFDQSDLQAALDAKSDTGHQHSIDDVLGIGAAAQLGVAASGIASPVEVVTGADPRLVDTRDPNPHTHPQSDIDSLPADMAVAKADWINVFIDQPQAGTFPLEEYAPVGMTVTGIAHRAPTGSVTLAIALDGVTVTGTAVTTLADQSRALATATGTNAVATGARSDLVVSSATVGSQLSLTVMRVRT
jgi:hypothetical protein